MARPWQDFSLKWLEQVIDASGFGRRFKITHHDRGYCLYVGEKTVRNWHVRSPPKIVCLHVNNAHFTHFLPRKMPLIRTRKSRARHLTPPLKLTSYNK